MTFTDKVFSVEVGEKWPLKQTVKADQVSLGGGSTSCIRIIK